MRTRVRALSLTALAAALLILAACGGDDSKAEKKTRDSATVAPSAVAAVVSTSTSGSSATSAGSTRASSSTISKPLQLDCKKEIKSFRFEGKVAAKTLRTGGSNAADPTSLISGLLENVKFSGAFVAPDRAQVKLEGTGNSSPLTGQGIEFVQIGTTSFFRLGATGWQQQQDSGINPTEQLDPREICTSVQNNFSADVPSRKEKANGVDATRYEYDRKALTQAGDDFLGGLASSSDLPENTKMSIWVSEKDKFPVKIQVNGNGQQAGQPVSLDLEINVTDLNNAGIKIDAPR